MSSLGDYIDELEGLVAGLKVVVYGDFVLAPHVNVFVDFCSIALNAVKKAYDDFKAKTGRTLPHVEEMIEMAETRVGLMRKVKYGDLVLTRDHNLIFDTLKPLELAVKEIYDNL
jgi:hypothetical protein